MRRFWGLLVNEHIKVLMKLSTKIMLVIVALSAVGLMGLQAWSEAEMRRWEEEYAGVQAETSDSWEHLIESLEKDHPTGWEREASIARYCLANGIGMNEWRSRAVSDWYQAEDEGDAARAEQLKAVVESNNFKGYLDAQAEAVRADGSLSAAERDAQLYAIFYERDHEMYLNDDWRFSVLRTYTSAAAECAQYDETNPPVTAEERAKYEESRKTMLIAKYRLDHQVEQYIRGPADGGGSYWENFTFSSRLLSVISVLIIIIAGSSVAGEFSQGTVKFLLINPIKRWKIFAAKYCSVLTFALVMVTLFYGMNALFAGVFFGFGDVGVPYLAVSGDTVVRTSGFLYTAQLYLYGLIPMISIGTMAFMLSSLVRSAALSIGISVFLLMGSSTAMMVLANMELDWGRYLLFANTDLPAILRGDALFPNQTPAFAVTVVAIYMIVFLLTAFDAFTRRDVK